MLKVENLLEMVENVKNVSKSVKAKKQRKSIKYTNFKIPDREEWVVFFYILTCYPFNLCIHI